MPYAADVYTVPPGTTATTLTPIDSSDYNAFVADIAAAQNAARPVVAGGTGATSASAARTNLGLAIGTDVLALAGASGLLYGCTLSNNGSDSTNDIDFASGVCIDSTGAKLITCAAMTKRLDADWGAGTNAGMRYKGAAITDTTYHLYAASKADGTQDYYADPSAVIATVLTHLQAETGGGSFLYLRRVGSILRESGAIVPFVQDGDVFSRIASVQPVSTTTPGSTAVLSAVSVPLGIRVRSRLLVGIVDTSSTELALVSDPSMTDVAPSPTGAAGVNVRSHVANVYGFAPLEIFTDTSGRVRYRVLTGAGTCTIKINSLGWIDQRGRL